MSNGDEEARVFKALASTQRRRMLDFLKDRPNTTGAIAAAFPELDRTTVMQHLRVLEEADLIVVRRQGRERWNHLNAMPIKQIHDRWIGDYARHAVAMLAALKEQVEGSSGD